MNIKQENPKTVEEAIAAGKKLIKLTTSRLTRLDEYWRGNIEVMLALIDYRVDAYQYASVAIREDAMLARMVVEKSPKMFKYVEGGLNGDIDLIKIALKNSRNGFGVFKYISEELKDNKSFIMSYISKYPRALEFVSDRLKDDETIVKMALSKNPNALKFASTRFKDDEELVLGLMNVKATYKDEFGRTRKDTRNLYLIKYASDRLRSDPKIVNSTINQDVLTYRCFSLKVRSNKKFALTILKKEGVLLDSVSKSLRNDKEVVLTAVKSYGYALEYASDELKADREVVIAAIKKDGRALMYASPELRKDIDLINLAFSKNGPFIIEPVAQRVFERLDSQMLRNTNAKTREEIEQNLKSNSHYMTFKKFYNGTASAEDVLALQEILLAQAKESDFAQTDEFSNDTVDGDGSTID